MFRIIIRIIFISFMKKLKQVLLHDTVCEVLSAHFEADHFLLYVYLISLLISITRARYENLFLLTKGVLNVTQRWIHHFSLHS